jgi:Protein of unknown function, DUF547
MTRLWKCGWFAVLLWLGLAGHAATAAGPAFDPSHRLLSDLLRGHLTNGLVDYAALTRDPRCLDDYLASTASVCREQFDQWSREDRIAFLINVYNASTLRLVRDHYPVSSIRKIGGFFTSPWKLRSVKLWGKEWTLDEVEHDILRKEYQEPRIHFALVCAARGCPPLRTTAYVGSSLNNDLDEQGRLFFTQSAKNRVDADRNTLWLSPIFDWYGKDFLTDGKSLPEALSRWMSPADAAVVNSKELKVRFTEYDWSLNDTAKP